MTPAIHPEIQRITELNAVLRDELARLLLLAHDLTKIIRPNLLALYQTKIGEWELEKLKAQFRVARLKRTIELVQAALNHGAKPDMVQIETQVQEEQALWKRKVEEAVAKLQEAEQHLGNLLPDEQSAELKKLYHHLVKQLHPDLHPEQTPGDKLLWQEVQDAYDARDLDKLQAEHDLLEKRINQLELRIKEMESQPPFTLRENLENEAWITLRRTALEEETEPLQIQAAMLEKHLETLVPPPHVTGFEFGPN